MRLASWVLPVCVLVVGGCSDSSGFDDDYPVRPGGGGGGGGIGDPVDARVQDGVTPDGSATQMGRVCVISDLRRWTSGCAPSGVADLTVTIGTETATTADDGRFTIMRPAGADLVVRVEGGVIEPSRIAYDPAAATVQAVAPTTPAWNAVLAQTSIAPSAGNGTLLLELRNDGIVVPGIVADSIPAPGPGALGTFYDNPADPTLWDTDQTDADGKALLADLPSGSVSVTATFMGNMETRTFTVDPDAITFGVIDISML